MLIILITKIKSLNNYTTVKYTLEYLPLFNLTNLYLCKKKSLKKKKSIFMSVISKRSKFSENKKSTYKFKKCKIKF